MKYLITGNFRPFLTSKKKDFVPNSETDKNGNVRTQGFTTNTIFNLISNEYSFDGKNWNDIDVTESIIESLTQQQQWFITTFSMMLKEAVGNGIITKMQRVEFQNYIIDKLNNNGKDREKSE